MTKFSFILLLIFSNNLYSSELIYTPINPSFGGFSGNGTVLLNLANAENKYKDPDAVDPFSRGAGINNFKETLNRLILSQLASKIVTDTFGDGAASGTYTTSDYQIDVDPTDGTLTIITITELSTGSVSIIEIPVI
jgi:curli production assembly/transport component CsgF